MLTTREWRFVDKAPWGPGPWDDEPDKVQWEDATTQLACMARRGPAGHWCGYVGVDESNRLYGIVDYSDLSLSVHGGLTYASVCDGDEERGICHVPEPGGSEPLFWFGFDCAHAGDLSPRFAREPGMGGTYKPLRYVQNECADLARQIHLDGGR